MDYHLTWPSKGRGSRDMETEDDLSGSDNEDDVWR